MGLFSGAKPYNTGNELAAQRAQNAQMQASAQSYSNYRIANAQARQKALENLMSLYAGPNQALAGISGGRGADMSQVGMNPFNSSPGYFNIGRAAPTHTTTTYGSGPTQSTTTDTGSGMSVNAAGDQGYGLHLQSNAPGNMQRFDSAPQVMGSSSYVGQSGQAPYRSPAQNPFAYNPGGRR